MTEERAKKIESQINYALSNKKVISFRTYTLSDYGEDALKIILTQILKHFKRQDLMDIVYTSVKELLINATKANIKRALFHKLELDPLNEDDYHTGMLRFKEELRESKLIEIRKTLKALNYPVITTFYFKHNVLNIKVKNRFILHPVEEGRIRTKFNHARAYHNLIEFFAEHGDDSEGAGLGLTMVGILLEQFGIDSRSFTLFSNSYGETAAKLEIPLKEDYQPKRLRFEEELAQTNFSREEFRQIFNVV